MKASLRGFSIGAVLLALYVSVFVAVEVNPTLVGFTFQQKAAGIVVALLIILVVDILRQLDKKSLLHLLVYLGIFGILLSGLLTYTHYVGSEEFCPAPAEGEAVPCDVVLQSKWGEFYGFPTAFIGVFGYLAITVLLLLRLYPKQIGNIIPFLKKYSGKAVDYLVLFAALGFAFTIYLNYIQFFKLMTLCALCELSATTITLLFIGSLILKWRG